MKPVKLINLVKKLFPEATVTIAVADPDSPESSHLVCFSAYGTGVCIDCSDDGYSIYDNVGDDELHLSFKDPLHVLPFIYRCLDSGKAEPELPQYDQFVLSAFNHHLRLSVDDFIVWPCGTWCYRSELPEMNHMTDDYEVLPAFSDAWDEFIPELLVPFQKDDGGYSL